MSTISNTAVRAPYARRALQLLAFIATASLVAGPALAKPSKETAAKAMETLERATRSADFATRAMAVEALGYGKKKDVKKLVDEALTDPQWIVRRAGIKALRTLKDKKGWDKAVRENMKKKDVDLTADIFPLIEDMGPKKGVAFIFKSLKDKKFPAPDRVIQLLMTADTAWMNAGFITGLKLKKGALRDAFVLALDQLPLPAGLPVLKARLLKEDAALQKRLLERIAALDAGDVAFIKPLLKSKDADVAFRTAQILAYRKDGSGHALLSEAAKGPDAGKRLLAMQALGPIATKADFDLARPVIKDREADPALLRAAYQIFVNVGNPKLETHLMSRLQSTDVNFRAAAIAFIGDVKGREALPQLYPLISDGPDLIRRTAVETIGKLRQREAIPHLRDALSRERDTEVRVQLLHALGKIHDADIIPVIRFYVSDPDVEVRTAAVETLVSVAHEDAVADLEMVLRDRSKTLREMALRALVELDPDKHFDAFKRSLAWLEPVFLERLAAQKKGDALRHVKEGLRASRAEMRATAFSATEHLGAKEELAIAENLALESKFLELRLAGLHKLVQKRKKKAVPVLQTLARDKDEQIRVAAIEALGRLGTKDAEQLLLDTTVNPAEKIRVAAAAALMRL